MISSKDTPNIIDVINSTAKDIKDTDIEFLVPKLLDHYNNRINYLAYKTYNTAIENQSSIALRAFKEYSKIEIEKALKTYLFNSQHWKQGRDINTYLLVCLNYLSKKIKSDISNIKKSNVLICPACRFLGSKEILINEDKLLRCENCTNELERLSTEQNHLFDSVKKLRNIFSLHTKSGKRCTDCERFIPESYCTLTKISCPYSNCAFFGNIDQLEVMSHPSSTFSRANLSLDQSFNDDENTALYNKVRSGDVGIDNQIAIYEQFQIEFNIIKEIINIQKERLKDTGFKATAIQKGLMYQAYENILIKYPEEMISYLVHLKSNSEISLQSKIFQEYVGLIVETIPFDIYRAGKKIEIMSLTDPYLTLFSDISIFDEEINSNYIVPNSTKEVYVGKSKHYGPCFIGKIIDILDTKTGQSLKKCIDEYNFSEIKMNKDIIPGTKVTVKHYNLRSHYETGPLVLLRRVRRKIVDSVYLKLNGKKREIK